MIENDIKYVNINLSSKYYSKNLEDFINKNKDKLIIVSSASNLRNTLDYPSMYDNISSVGVKNNTNEKYLKIGYRTNKILILGKNLSVNYYNGNSFLAIVHTVNESSKHLEGEK